MSVKMGLLEAYWAGAALSLRSKNRARTSLYLAAIIRQRLTLTLVGCPAMPTTEI